MTETDPTRPYVFYGESDDCIEVGGPVREEFYADRDGRWSGTLTNGKHQLRVTLWFDGCWHAAVGQTDEEHPLPTWGIGIGQHTTDKGDQYSARLIVSAPAGTVLAEDPPRSQ
ncbi:hypothetical protein QNA23_10795 [Rhodococcus erythropolis]|uniref:hypothetical protein n=1 Tax=Rhodococcus erythropolis TaxID=1833 RepID=UPI0024BA35A4|nr:hypothetical protein [Rhodococcus erythropolis]MDJ0403970.1 hypothetical protein [Rhodococcus erythropolis]